MEYRQNRRADAAAKRAHVRAIGSVNGTNENTPEKRKIPPQIPENISKSNVIRRGFRGRQILSRINQPIKAVSATASVEVCKGEKESQ